jgi:hypothetical protein
VDWARTSFQIEFAFCLGTSCKAMALPKVSPQKKKQSRFKPNHVHCRVARWFIFKPNDPIWVNSEGLGTENVDILYNHLEYFLVISLICGCLV